MSDHRIQDHVHALTVGQSPDFGLEVLGAVVDRMINALSLDGLTSWAGEAEVVLHDVSGVRGRGHQPQDAVGIVERLEEGPGVAVGTADDLGVFTYLRSEPVGVAGDHADGLPGGDELADDLPADLAGGCGNDDHGNLR